MRSVQGRLVYDTLEELVDPKHTAVIAVDMQNDFCHPGGHFARQGKDLSHIIARVPTMVSFVTESQALGVRVVFIRQCTGLGIAASLLGKPDVSIISMGEMVDRTHHTAHAVDLPVMGDGDTGFGNAVNVYYTVQEFERAGAAGVNIEDQVMPKRCGHLAGKEVIPMEEMVLKIEAAREALVDKDFVIIARTDARTTEGIERALARACVYQEAGADVIFVESPESEEEMRRVTRWMRAPTLVNMVEGGRTPILPAAALQEIGYRIAIYPNSLTRALGRAGQQVLRRLKADGSTEGLEDSMMDHRELWALFEYEKWTEIERRLGAPGEFPG